MLLDIEGSGLLRLRRVLFKDRIQNCERIPREESM